MNNELKFNQVEEQSKELVKNKSKLKLKIDAAIKKFNKSISQNKCLLGVKHMFILTIEMLNDVVSNDFIIKKTDLILIIAGIIYFLSPADFIPDLVPVLGFTDDAAFLSYIYVKLKDTYHNYEIYKKHKDICRVIDNNAIEIG